jgi:antitoxin YefM
MIDTTYSHARANLASLCDNVSSDREIVLIHRRGAADVALIAADELAGIVEAAHLMRSPANAERLRTALARAQRGEGQPETVAGFRTEVGLVTAR